MSMQRPKFVVRWTDQDGNDKRREYDAEKDARKAKDWLIDNGAASVDIAIRVGGREVNSASPEPSMFPTKEAPVQQGFI